MLLLTIVVFGFVGSFVPVRAELTKSRNEARLRICQAKEAGLRNRQTRMLNLAGQSLDNLQTKLDRVVGFYTDKIVPKGITIANFGSLLDKAGMEKQEALGQLSQARLMSNNFSCQSDDPLSQVNEFGRQMNKVNQSIKDYRYAIINLTTAVKNAR